MSVIANTQDAVRSSRFGRQRPLSVSEYLRMIDSGILPESTSYFLWKGRIVAKSAKT